MFRITIIFLTTLWASSSWATDLTPRQAERLVGCVETNIEKDGRFTVERCKRRLYILDEKEPQYNRGRLFTNPSNTERVPRFRRWAE
jgi:hypothetical protein